MLDLGCGDALEISKTLERLPVVSYQGIDLSAMALDLAVIHLKGIADVKLTQGAMEKVIGEAGAGFNAVYSSYAIHHLNDGQKIQLLKSIHGVLETSGLFILIDIFRKPGQEREDYIERYEDLMRTRWTMLTPEERQFIMEHITSSDFPASIDQFKDWTRACGFETLESYEADEQHKTFIFRKS